MNLVTLNHKTFPFLYKCCSAQLVFKHFMTKTTWSMSSNVNKRERGDGEKEKSEREGGRREDGR